MAGCDFTYFLVMVIVLMLIWIGWSHINSEKMHGGYNPFIIDDSYKFEDAERPSCNVVCKPQHPNTPDHAPDTE